MEDDWDLTLEDRPIEGALLEFQLHSSRRRAMPESQDPPEQVVMQREPAGSRGDDEGWDLSGVEPPVTGGLVEFRLGRERTRAVLSYLLFGLFALLALSLVFLFAVHRATVDEVRVLAEVLVTPLVGLLGVALAFFFRS